MTRLAMIAALAGLSFAAQGQAQVASPQIFQCNFAIECLDDQCHSTDHRGQLIMELAKYGGWDGAWTAGGQTIELPTYIIFDIGGESVQSLYFLHEPHEVIRTLAVTRGAARLVEVRRDQPLVITHIGTCTGGA